MSADLNDPFAERAVLGGCIAKPARIADVATIIRPADFSLPRHSVVFEALVEMDGDRRPIDTITLADELKLRGKLVDAGGVAFLVELDTAAPTAANVIEYASIVSDRAQRRKLVDIARDLMREAHHGEGGVSALVSKYENRLLSLSDAAPKSRMRHMGEVMQETWVLLDRIEKVRGTGGVIGLPTGLVDLDRKLTGLHGGQLVIVGARPSVGKTAFALQMLVHASHHRRVPSAVFSLETAADQLGLRAVAAHAGVPLSRLRGETRMSDTDITKTNNAMAALADAPIYVDDSPMLDVTRMRSDARRLKRKHPDLGLVVVDYLQLMTQEDAQSREQEVSQAARGLKVLAGELDVPVVALAQIGRKAEDRKGGKPKMSDLRESGAIEAHADVVLLLWPEEPDEDEPPGPELGVEVLVEKQKMGPTGSVPVTLRREYTQFVSRMLVDPDAPVAPPREAGGYTAAPEEAE